MPVDDLWTGFFKNFGSLSPGTTRMRAETGSSQLRVIALSRHEAITRIDIGVMILRIETLSITDKIYYNTEAWWRINASLNWVKSDSGSLFGDKLSPERILTYCHLGPREQISVIFESKYKNILTITFGSTISVSSPGR